jgi:hypothetical protein
MRHQDWEYRLNEFLKSVGPFEWGANDCCMFAVNAVESMTGKDHGKQYRGYKTALGAARRLEKFGGVEGIATIELGDLKPIKQSKRGDVVSIQNGENIILGICLGVKMAAVSEEGLTFFSMSVARNAWSV